MRKGLQIFAMMVILLAGCTAERLEREPQEETVTTAEGVSVKVSSLQPGSVRIYVSEETAARLEANPEAFISENAHLGVTGVKRVFPFDEAFEARTRECGLHRWYEVSFDSGMPLTKAGREFGAIKGVSTVEYRPKIVRFTGQPVGWKHASTAAYSALRNKSDANPLTPTQLDAGDMPFDDPGLEQQWHYRNLNDKNHSVPGCDINVFPAWRNFKPGNPDVIVAVVDGGIDFRHEDLNDNMWRNPDQEGDNVYGYNFIKDNYKVTADTHGTHVAGTISAVNNNGIGCCGIAGGDAKAGIGGVKLMSCQIFSQNEDDSGDDVAAIKWASDHGAVICTNSWAYDGATYLPSSAKAAIDYFNTYSGIDIRGNQTGPMKGGLVLFAAGNEFTKEKVYPSCYTEVLAVSALGADFKLASYSNYGDWVDIAAPGGDDEYDIYSTYPNNSYEYNGGTSMSTPHVAGVAALIVANFAGEGFTRENLIDILMHHTTDISEYNQHKYPGVGLVNAAASISSNTGEADFYISDLDITTVGCKIKAGISLKPTSVESDAWISAAYIYYSETPFSEPEGIPSFRCEIGSKISSEAFEIESDRLEYGRRYYVSVAMQDEYGHMTSMTRNVTIDTPENLPPVIEGPEGPFTVKSHENLELSYSITDPYGDALTIELISDNGRAVQMNARSKPVKIYIQGFNSDPGTFSFTLKATDEFGKGCEATMEYSVVNNHAPELAEPIEDLIIGDNKTLTMDLDRYFHDPDGEELRYTVSFSNTQIAKVTVDGSSLTIIPQQYGTSNVTVTATDALGKQASDTFRLLLRDGGRDVELYPNPVTGGKLYARTGKKTNVDISITNAAGGLVLHRSAEIDPFDPVEMDMSALAAGAYNVTTTADGNTTTTKIVKL